MTRRESKAEARERMFYQLNKEIAIGIDPIFFNANNSTVSRAERKIMSTLWQVDSKKYDLENK